MKPDWIIHYILADRPSSHTHGLDRHGSLELELNLPVPQEKAQMILNLLGLEITQKRASAIGLATGRTTYSHSRSISSRQRRRCRTLAFPG